MCERVECHPCGAPRAESDKLMHRERPHAHLFPRRTIDIDTLGTGARPVENYECEKKGKAKPPVHALSPPPIGRRWSVTGETNIRALHNTVRGHGAGLESQRSLAPPRPRGARRTLRQHSRNAARSSASLTLSPLRPERRCGRVRGRQWAGSSPLAGICGPRSGPNLALGFQIHTSKGPGRAPRSNPTWPCKKM